MKFRPMPVLLLVLLLAVLAGVFYRKSQGPELAAHQVQAQPLQQTVVATGRVAAVSRAQVGSPVTGVVVARRVQEGDRVQPGDVLAVLRADDLAAAVRESEAALAQLQQSTRPQAQAALQEASARLAQASREAQRRRELFARDLIAREAMEQAVQAETSARTAVAQAQLALRALDEGQPAEAAARARLASSRAQLAKTTVRAEVAGTVLTRNAEPGDLCSRAGCCLKSPAPETPKWWSPWMKKTSTCWPWGRRPCVLPMPTRRDRSAPGSVRLPPVWMRSGARWRYAWPWRRCRILCGRA